MLEQTRTDRTAVLLPFVLVSFAANSLITRHVVARRPAGPGLLSAVRFLAGAAALLALALPAASGPWSGGATCCRPCGWGVYAGCISYGYQHIGAAAGTFVFYAAVLLTLVAGDRRPRHARVPAGGLAAPACRWPGWRCWPAGRSARSRRSGSRCSPATGVAWGLYTAAGRGGADPRVATTGHFASCWPRCCCCPPAAGSRPGCASPARAWRGRS